MKIDKKLFEDALSGKLKGTFILRDGTTFDSRCLKRTEDTSLHYNADYPYALVNKEDNSVLFVASYTENGTWSVSGIFSNDIIDFIPRTDATEVNTEIDSYNEKDIQLKHFINSSYMKQNEMTIEIPYNKIVDWDESKKQNKIVLKDKQLTYKDICEKLFSKLDTYYYVNNHGNISAASSICNPYIINPNSSSTEHQLECILAKNKLATVAKYLNDGWKPLHDSDIFLLIETKTGVSEYEVINGCCASDCGSIWFKSKELARQAIEILGEETVKLALEPLGI